jgi:alkylation response protein AidB-like acyl-CoA dehydrogenase
MNDQSSAENVGMDPEELRDAARRLLQDLVDRRAPYAGRLADQGEALFARMVEQGWTLLTIDADEGGLGQSFAALAPIYEEMGRAVSPVFLAPTMAVLEALSLAKAASGAAELAQAVAAGEARLAAAVAPAGMLQIAEVDGVHRVSGSIPSVVVDPGVTHLLLASRGEGDVLLVSLASEGASRTPVEMWDRSRQAADIRLQDASAVALTGAERVLAHLDLALAWDSIGGARQALEETIEYMGVRQQFGRPIGSFQALKHRAADHKVALEMAAALAREATAAFAEGRPLCATSAGQARLLANQAYRAISEDAIQLHGGIGFTWEHDCHFFMKRAWLNEMLFGTPDQRRDALAPALLERVRASA